MDSVSNPPWSDLPQDLLSTISNLLSSNPPDGLAFRAVCKSWLISSSPVFPFTLDPVLPITVAHPRSSFDARLFDEKHGLPIISTTVIFLFRHPEHETESWIMFADQLTPGKLMIRRPLTKSYYSMPMSFPKSIDVPNVHVEEIGRFYNLNFHSEVNKPPSMWSEYVNKVVLNFDESFAIALFQTGKLGLLNLRSILCGKWKRICPSSDDGDARIDDIVNLKGTFLAVDSEGKLYNVNLSQCTMKVVADAPCSSDYGEKRMRLMESNGILYLVVTYGVDRGEKDMFKVFEFDDDLDKWVQVNSIDNMVFFIGLDFSFSISSRKLGGSFGKECIVYNTDSFDYDQGVYSDSDTDSDSGSGGGSAGESETGSGSESGSEGGSDSGSGSEGRSDSGSEGGSDSGSEGGSEGGSESEHKSEGEDRSDTESESENDVESDGEDEGESGSRGRSEDGRESGSKARSESEDMGKGESESESESDTESDCEGAGEGEGESDGEDEGEGEGEGEGESESDGEDEGEGEGESESESEDESEGSIEVEDESGSHGGGIDIRIWHMTDTCPSGGCLDLLWPPPTWLWSIDMSKRIVDVEAALDDILANAPAEKLEAISTDLFLMLTRFESVNGLCKSINLQNNQVGTSSNVGDFPRHCEAVISNEMKKLNGNILLVEELMTKMHRSVKSRQQPSHNTVE